LSGGEAQRIRLATQIGAALVGVLYVLDEPSIGLHQRDNDRLLATLKGLRDLGNTVLVVEHDADTIRAADYILDLGPGAGVHGGELVAAGTLPDILASPKIAHRPVSHRRVEHSGAQKAHCAVGRKGWLEILGAKENNLQNIDVRIPLGTFTCVTGVSGSGKSTLVDDILRARCSANSTAPRNARRTSRLEGFEGLDKVIVIDQSPIGRTPRSNPATYTGHVQPDPRPVRQAAHRQGARLRTGPVQFQREGRPLRKMRGRRHPEDRDEFLPPSMSPARPATASVTTARRWKFLQGQEYRRCAGHDGG
jgi:excinuclease ABC subunit A